MSYSKQWYNILTRSVDFTDTLNAMHKERHGYERIEDAGEKHGFGCFCDDCSLFWRLKCLSANGPWVYELPEWASSLQSARIVEAARRKDESK